MKIVFMGTPDYAAKALEKLIDRHDVTAVITQPDKPVGRGNKIKFPPVKELALEKGIEVFQPNKVKSKEFVEILKNIEADVFVVAAYGQILSKEILEMPKYGCVNIHASLLPKYRGAAPIQWAIADGEKETGITIMQMDSGIDTGDMLFKKAIPIMDSDTGGSLHDKLAVLGGEAVIEALELIESGKITPEPQNNDESCYAKMLTKETGRIYWNISAAEIERLVRAMNPWPCAYSDIEGLGMVKILKARAIHGESAPCGVISEVDKRQGFFVGTGDGLLLVENIQVSGKKAMDVSSFLLGNKLNEGLKLN